MSYANSGDTDQTLQSAASDLGLRCLPMSHSWNCRHKRGKFEVFCYDVHNVVK